MSGKGHSPTQQVEGKKIDYSTTVAEATALELEGGEIENWVLHILHDLAHEYKPKVKNPRSIFKLI